MFSQRQTFARHKKVKLIHLPELPKDVVLNLVNDDFHILTDEECQSIKQLSLADGYHTKTDLGSQYNIVKSGDNIIAITDFRLGSGAYGDVMLGQNTTTGEWLACKTGSIQSNEASSLQQVGLLADLSPTPSVFRMNYANGYANSILLMKLIHGTTLGNHIPLKNNTHHKAQLAISYLKMGLTLNQSNIRHGDNHYGNFMYDYEHNMTYAIDFGYSGPIKNSSTYDDQAYTFLLFVSALNHGGDHNPWWDENIKPLIEKAMEVQHPTQASVTNAFTKLIASISKKLDQIPENRKTYRIGAVDIDAYLKNKGKLHPRAKEFDEIWLIDRKEQTKAEDYLSAHETLRKKGFFVSHTVLKHHSLFRLEHHLHEACKRRHPGATFEITNAMNMLPLQAKSTRANQHKPISVGVKRKRMSV